MTAVGIGLVLVVSTIALLVLAFCLFGVGISWFGVVNARFVDTLGDDEQAIEFGLFGTVALLLGAAGSVATGSVVDAASWLPAFGLVGGLLLTATVFLVGSELFGLGL